MSLPIDTKEDKKVKINEESCKGCGFCMKFCPDNAISFHTHFNSRGFHPVKHETECRLCGKCYIMCPDSAIEVLR